MDNLDTIKANGGTGIRFRDPQVIGAGERGNAYDVSGDIAQLVGSAGPEKGWVAGVSWL
jgi:hypothetical protein